MQRGLEHRGLWAQGTEGVGIAAHTAEPFTSGEAGAEGYQRGSSDGWKDKALQLGV